MKFVCTKCGMHESLSVISKEDNKVTGELRYPFFTFDFIEGTNEILIKCEFCGRTYYIVE